MKCSMSAPRMYFLIETLENNTLRISDKKKGKVEGEIFEEFYWSNSDITLYSNLVKKIAERFGGYFDGRDIFITSKISNFNNALYNFFNMATLFTEFGRNINLPKPRK